MTEATQETSQEAQAGTERAPFNTLAIVSFISTWFLSLVGIITGHIALAQIRKSGERGRGLALAGTIIGYVGFVATLLMLTVTLAVGSVVDATTAALAGAGSSDNGYATSETPSAEDVSNCEQIQSILSAYAASDTRAGQSEFTTDIEALMVQNTNPEFDELIGQWLASVKTSDASHAAQSSKDISAFCDSVLSQ